jgi:hypothetical protein
MMDLKVPPEFVDQQGPQDHLGPLDLHTAAPLDLLLRQETVVMVTMEETHNGHQG